MNEDIILNSEEKINRDLERVVWTSEKVKEVAYKISTGYKVKIHPFWEGNPNWRAANVVFKYTEEEMAEKIKCKENTLYFAENYAYIMTGDKGKQKVKLRDYQEEILLSYIENKETILMASRQSGKCNFFTTFIYVKDMQTKQEEKVLIGDFYFRQLTKTRKLFFKEKILWTLWKLYSFFEKKAGKT